MWSLFSASTDSGTSISMEEGKLTGAGGGGGGGGEEEISFSLLGKLKLTSFFLN